MTLESLSLWPGPGWFALLVILFFGLRSFAGTRRRRGRRRKAFVETRPELRPLLRRLGLTDANHFLSLPTLLISGHPDRNVGRVLLGSGPDAVPAFLKREHRVSWKVRLLNALAGHGLVSRSLRECQTLQSLQREGLPASEWLAAGENGQGQAFLLIREIREGIDLHDYLQNERDAGRRREVARAVGVALARLHHLGFVHPDLYAKHILVQREQDPVVLLDWQRARRQHRISWKQRGQDLSALHATLATELASPVERLCCLRSYLAETGRQRAGTGQPFVPRRLFRRPEFRVLLASLLASSRRRLRRRHILEKRQPAGDRPRQDFRCLDGDALCVTSALAEVWPDRSPSWLSFKQQPAPKQGACSRRYLAVSGQRRALLVRRRGLAPLGSLWSWLRGRPWSSAEQQQSVLLLRLQRHGIGVPRVLAMGQRQGLLGQRDSFLLTELPERTLRLDAWLQRQALRKDEGGRLKDEGKISDSSLILQPSSFRRRLLWQAGVLLARLHQACYSLDPSADGRLLAVQILDDPARSALVLDRIDWVLANRAPRPPRARRDYQLLQEILTRAGCTAAEREWFGAGYRQHLADIGGVEWRRDLPVPKEAACRA